MKTKIYSLWLCLCFFIVASLASYTAFADFGNFDTYENDYGSSDWGSYDSDYGDDWSSSGNYHGGYYVSSGDTFDDDGDLPIFAVIIIVAAVIAVAVMKSQIKTKTSASSENSFPNVGASKTVSVPVSGSYSDKTADVESEIIKYDPAFTSGKLLSLVKESYVKFQAAWTKRDIAELRPLQSEELFSQSAAQIEEYIRLGKINIMERVAVNDAYIVGHRTDNSKEYIDVFLTASQKDYVIDEKTKQVLEGNPSQYRKISYIITLMRAKGEKTQASDCAGNNSDVNGQSASSHINVKTANCPNCGAPLEITAAGKCAYCDSIISSDSHSWVISAMKRA